MVYECNNEEVIIKPSWRLLWTNTNPTAAMNAQTINFNNVKQDNENLILVEYKNYSTETTLFYDYINLNKNTRCILGCHNTNWNYMGRIVRSFTNNSFYISTVRGGSYTRDNTYAILTRVWAAEGNLPV